MSLHEGPQFESVRPRFFSCLNTDVVHSYQSCTQMTANVMPCLFQASTARIRCSSITPPWCNMGFSNITLETLPAALHSQPVMAPPRLPVSPTFAPPSHPATPASPPHVLMVALDASCSLAPNILYTLPSVTFLTGPGSVDLRYFTSRWALPSGQEP